MIMHEKHHLFYYYYYGRCIIHFKKIKAPCVFRVSSSGETYFTVNFWRILCGRGIKVKAKAKRIMEVCILYFYYHVCNTLSFVKKRDAQKTEPFFSPDSRVQNLRTQKRDSENEMCVMCRVRLLDKIHV